MGNEVKEKIIFKKSKVENLKNLRGLFLTNNYGIKDIFKRFPCPN